MKLVSKIPEDVIVAEFLLAEFNSDRFRNGIIDALCDHDSSLITKPNLNDQTENQLRRNILGEYH